MPKRENLELKKTSWKPMSKWKTTGWNAEVNRRYGSNPTINQRAIETSRGNQTPGHSFRNRSDESTSISPDEEEFTVVSSRKRRKAEKAEKTQQTATPQTTTTQTQSTNKDTTSTKRDRKVPQIILREKGKSTSLSKYFSADKIDYGNAKAADEGFQLNPSTKGTYIEPSPNTWRHRR